MTFDTVATAPRQPIGQRGFSRLLAVSIAPIAAACALVCCVASLPAQALLLRGGSPVRVPVMHGGLLATIAKVVAGPDATERRSGLRSAVPAGTRLIDANVQSGIATLRLSPGFEALLGDEGTLELALEQLNKSTINVRPDVQSIAIEVERADGSVHALRDLLRPRERLERAAALAARASAPAPGAQFRTGSGPGIPGALNGRVIAISPGHGYYWHSTLGWTTQRGQIDGLTEDIHTNEIAMRFLIPYLENMGAAVISCRERGEVFQVDSVRDNDAGSPTYTTTGLWTTSSSSGYAGSTYQFAVTRSGSTPAASATWELPIARDGMHPVYVWYRAGSNRSSDARYEVRHSGGISEVSVDQSRDDLTWVPLGSYHFTAAEGARITLTDVSVDPGKVVIADAVRVGAGSGSIARGGSTSGRPRWQEASRYWAQFNGAPSSVWNSVSTGQDNGDDVTCRPRFAEWRGADAYVSLHTNAGGGAGTSSFIYNGGATAGSSTLQNRIHQQIIGDLRSGWSTSWVDRGQRSANFGEVRALSSMPGVLIELAFHDTAGSFDHDSLHEPEFRRIGGRAIARGLMRYFDPTASFPPDAPRIQSVRQNGLGGLRVRWFGVGGTTRYTIEASTNGKGFVEVGSVNGSGNTTWSTAPLPPHSMRSFRVRAWNASGRSFPSEVLTAGTTHRGAAELLLVQGFDRLGRNVKTPDNSFDYLALHGDAIRRSGAFSLGFDAATNEAVSINFVPLSDYRAVDWLCGEESTADETFSASEQAVVAAYLAGGGRLLVTGAEIGWDLEARGRPSDLAFYQTNFGADYVRDDAGTYAFRGRSGGIFEGIPTATFDNGLQGVAYDVDFPDVIQPFGTGSLRCMDYGNGQPAGVQRVGPAGERVVHLGFPLEAIVDPAVRAEVMERALRFLLDGRSLEVAGVATLGGTTPISLNLPTAAGQVYALGLSTGTGPLPLPGGPLLALSGDALLSATLGQSNAVTQNFGGTLSPQGLGSAALNLPLDMSLSGVNLILSGVTVQSVPSFAWGQSLPWFRIELR